MPWLFHALLTFFLVIVPAQRQQTQPLAPPQQTAPLDEEHESHHEHRIGDKREHEHRPLPKLRSFQPVRITVAHQAAEGFRTIIDPRALQPRWGASERRLC